MIIKVYQINLRRDSDRVAFQDLEHLPEYQGSADVNSALYDCVFEGDVDCATLEDVFRVFNLEHPAEYTGRSLSVSDVVEIPEGQGVEAGFYFCDSIGFPRVEFDPAHAQPVEKPMRVVLCEPGKIARVTYIQPGLESMQRIVGGDIEPFYAFSEEVCIVCNDEGKIQGLPPNRAVYIDPVPEEMSYADLCRQFREAERNGQHLIGRITFTEDSFSYPFSEEARTYVVSSQNKAFMPNMGGYSIYASALDGSDPMVRLEQYMADERGGENGWKIERCCLMPTHREMADLICGTFFICDCSGSDFGSLTQEQADRYAKEFRLPERFYREAGEVKAVPFDPSKEPER